MATTQELLSVMHGVQSSAQEALPVVPNNGNPGGANNMPNTDVAAAQLPANPYSWLEPSEYMQDIKILLEQQAQDLQVQKERNKYNVYYDTSVPGGRNLYQFLDDYGLPTDPTLPLYPGKTTQEQLEYDRLNPVLPEGVRIPSDYKMASPDNEIM